MENRKSVESNVVGVTVYRSGAFVTRSVPLARVDGTYAPSVLITNLPVCLDDGSIRTRVGPTTDGNAPLATAFHVLLDVPPKEVTKTDDALEEEIRNAQIQVDDASRRLAHLKEQKKQCLETKWVSRPNGEEGKPPISTPLEKRLEWLAFTTEYLKSLDTKITTWSKMQRERSKHHQSLLAKQRTASTARAPRPSELRKTVRITLDTRDATAESATLFIEYMIPGATWSPSYSLMMSPGKPKVDLTLRAVVTQMSGEDWNGVEITLSTALPKRFTPLKELKSLRIGKQQPTASQRPRPAPDTEILFKDYDRFMATRPLPDLLQRRSAPMAEPILEAEGCLDDEAPPAPMISEIPAPAPPPSPAPTFAAAAMPAPDLEMDTFVSETGIAVKSRTAAPRAAIVNEPPETAWDNALLDFGNLWMPSPQDPHRGNVTIKKKQIPPAIAQDGKPSHKIHKAKQHAHQAEQHPLPEGYRSPSTVKGFDYAYQGDHPVDIPSDGTFHSITLKTETSDAAMSYVSVPREEMQFFRRLSLINPFSAPLLPGPVEVVSGNEYLPFGTIDTTPKGGEVDIWLGVEQDIKIARNVTYKEATAGLLRGHLALKHGVAIDIVNHLKTDARLEIRERLPVIDKEEEEITVHLDMVTPDWQPFEEKEHPLKGGYAWHLTMKPSETKQLNARYTIEIPSKFQLSGGNRREA